MHGEGLNPRQIEDYVPSAEGCTTQIFKTNERAAGCRVQSQDNQGAIDVIGLIRKYGMFL